MNRIIAWFVHNRVAANLLMLFLVVGGLIAAPGIPQKLFPDIDLGLVTIEVAHPGAAPEEVEEGVCIPIEEAIASVVGVDSIRTVAAEGRCRIFAELFSDADGDVVASDIRNRVDSIRNLPEEAERPVVAKTEFITPVIEIALSGPVGEGTLKELGRRVRDEIAALDGITQASLHFDRPYEVSIEVPEESLRRYGLSFDQVVAAVRRSSLDLPGGSIKAPGGEILLRSKGQAYRGLDFEDVVVLTRRDGTRVTLADVATVVDGFEEVDLEASFDGEPTVMVRVSRVGNEDAIEISDAVHAYVAETAPRLPEGVSLTIWQDASEQLRGRLSMLFRTGRTGLLLVFAVLALFLRFRLAIWVTLGVPIALLGAVMMMPVIGASLDQATVFAFILVLGILVDDAIVVGENVYTHEGRSGDRVRAAIEGTQQVAVPVIFGVLTTVAAFFPMLVIPGRMGQIFFFMGGTVVICLVFSLVESQLVLPSHLSHGRSLFGRAPSKRKPGFRARWEAVQDRFAKGLQRFVEERYRPSLARAMTWRYTVMAVAVGALLLTGGLVAGGRVPFNFFPAVEADYVAAQVAMPQGTSVALTRAAVKRLEISAGVLTEELREDGASVVVHRLVSVGQHVFQADNELPRTPGGHLGEVVIELTPETERSVATHDVAQRWRELTGEIPGARELVFASELYSSGNAIDLQLRGSREAPLAEAAHFVRDHLSAYAGVRDVADSFETGKKEVRIELLPEAEPLGITMEALARQVRQAFYGEEAQSIQRGRDEVKVMVRYPEAERRSLASLENLRIRTPDGGEVPFWTVARADEGRGFADIRRTDRERVVSVTADVDRSRVTPTEVSEHLDRTVLPDMMARFPGVTVGRGGELQDQGRAFAGLVQIYPVALLAIFALLAIPLRSYLQPLLIMSAIPFGIVGAVAGHLLLGRSISFPSIMGIVALSGVVVNASLVLVVAVNRHRDEGRSLRDAVELASASRFRPIVLTAFTTFAGLTPLMLEGGSTTATLGPMAISLAFGVVFATAISLILVPCGYVIIEDVLRSTLRGGRWRPRAVGRAPGSRETEAA